MIGILAEKPSQARNFAKALGGMSGTYDGKQYTIVAARGHLYEFADPQEQVGASLKEKYKSWDVKNLPWDIDDFKWLRVKKEGVSSVIKDIVNTFKSCDEVCIATDDDPSGEGQLLAFEILLENNINKKFTRMYFADESEREVQKAFKNRKSIPNLLDDSDYKKALYRSKWDYLSMQFTRIATVFGDKRSVLRQGRLKSAMVLLVGDQLKAISEYKKIPFYTNRFRDENKNVYSKAKEDLYPKPELVQGDFKSSPIILDSKTHKSSPPPKLIDLATLSSLLASRGINAKTVLATYQKMYESQVVSYPRTEDKFITPEQFNDLLPKVDAIAKVVGVDVKLLTHRSPRATHVKTGCAHGANRPGPKVPSSLSDLDQYGVGAKEIYEILARNFLAMFAADYEYEQQKGHVRDYPDYVTSVNVPLSLGWKVISNNDDEDVDSSKGLGTRAEPFVHEGFPPKPTVPSMKWLMKQLEKRDVGTGATRTSVYAEVTNARSKYPLLSESRGKISMTNYGEMSYNLLGNTHIGDLSLTERLMKEMRDIASGKLNDRDGLLQIAQFVQDDIITMMKNRKEPVMEEKEKYTGVWNGKNVSFTRTWGGHYFTDEECAALCDGKEITITGLKSKSGVAYGVVGKLSDLTYNGRSYVGFERLRFASDDKVPASWCGHTFTEKERKSLEAGLTIYVEGLKSKAGNVFSCKLKWAEREDGSKGIVPLFNER